MVAYILKRYSKYTGRFSAFLIGVSFSLLVSSTFAQASGDKIRIAVGEWPPYISKGQKHNGVISHIITDIFSDIGVKATIHFLPWKRAYNMAALGMYNATAVWMHKDEREKDFLYSDAVLAERFVFFHKKSFQFDWKKVEDLKGLKIGGHLGYSYGRYLDAALGSGLLTIERVKNDELNFYKLIKGRIQIFPQEVNVASATLRQNFDQTQQDLITHHPKPISINNSFILFSKSVPENAILLSRFNKQLKQIRENGEYDRYMSDFKAGNYQK